MRLNCASSTAGSPPRHLAEVAVVLRRVVLERRQQLLVERVPQAQLDRWTAVRALLEERRDRLPVGPLRRRRQAQQHMRLDRTGKLGKRTGRQVMAFVDHDDVPMAHAAAREQPIRQGALDRREQVIVRRWPMPVGEQLAEVRAAQHLAVGRQRLNQNLDAVRDEQQARRRAELVRDALVIEGGDHRLAGAGRGDEQIAAASVPPLRRQAIEHRLLKRLRPQIKPGRQRHHRCAARLAAGLG